MAAVQKTPSQFNWNKSQEHLAKMTGKRELSHVGGDKKNVGGVRLSGAIKQWESSEPSKNRMIYYLPLRIAGTPEDVATTLTYAGYQKNDIDTVLADSITKDNYQTTKKAEYEAELEAIKVYKAEEAAKPKLPLSSYVFLEQQIVKGESKIVPNSGGKAATAGTKGGKKKSLAERITALKRDANGQFAEFLDVSGLDVNTGANVRKTAKIPKGKAGVSNIPFITNNIDKYTAAIELVYGKDTLNQLVNEINQVRAALTKAPATLPTANTNLPPIPAPTTSASVVPGASIAPAPSLVPTVASPSRPVQTMGGAGLPSIPALSNLLSGSG